MLPIDADIQDLEKNQIIEEKIIYTQSIKYHLALSKAGILASIVKIPPKDNKYIPYQELQRTFEDEQKINDLISTLGIKGKIALLLQESRLRKMGDELRIVHPFKFFAYIFTNPERFGEKGKTLKECMADIFDDYFKRTNFVKDYSQTMDIFDLKNQLVMYIEGFANDLGIPANQIAPFINNKNWEGLLRFLISY